MFLIQISESAFIDADKITDIGRGELYLYACIFGEEFIIHKDYESKFLNHIDAINGNFNVSPILGRDAE